MKWFWNLLTLDLRASFHDYHRASGEALCPVCRREYWRHPRYDEGLVLSCEGELLHL